MKTKEWRIATVSVLALLYLNTNAQLMNKENKNAIFPKGEKTPADYFTGTAWLNMLVAKDETGNYSIGAL
jgi:hypothetical protein